MIIMEESAPGSKWYLGWRDILHILDIFCCCLILFPIVWSINHLRLATDVDGKTMHSVSKLKLFREFCKLIIHMYI